jgi:hypothetical protein
MIFEKEGADVSPRFGYSRALRVAWRILWPPATVSGGMLSLLSYAPQYMQFSLLVFLLSNTAALFVFIGRIVSKPYEGFQIAVTRNNGTSDTRITLNERCRLWVYVYTRQLLGAGAGWFLLAPLNILLALLGIHVDALVSLGAIVLAINPLISKMLVDHAFEGFHLDVRNLEERARSLASRNEEDTRANP